MRYHSIRAYPGAGDVETAVKDAELEADQAEGHFGCANAWCGGLEHAGPDVFVVDVEGQFGVVELFGEGGVRSVVFAAAVVENGDMPPEAAAHFDVEWW